ncbi:MAG: hypothetical protein FWE11_05105 [Defluviitaleaceae bacterium]|nr:hypothetical protein [Defluviitaleaceae bacterium]
MDCNKAQLAMMEHMEKTIHPASAKELALHVLECEDCREYYIGFDMALEVLDDAELSVPPIDFTANVMEAVRKMPVHSKPIPMSMRIIWGLGAIFLGIALLFAFNPAWLTALTTASPAVYSAMAAMGSAQVYITEWLADLTAYFQGSEFAMVNVAIIFVAVVGALLVILQRSEKSTKA